MKRGTTMLGVATVLTCTVVLGAQTQQRQDQQQSGQQQQQPRESAPTPPSTQSQAPAGVQTSAQGQAAGSMTFIGCVEPGTAPNSFVLSVTEMPPASVSGQAQVGAGAGAAGPTGATVRGTSGASLVGQRLQLMGGGNLAAHAGHKVLISGTMASQSATAGQPQRERRFNVSNITMVAMTCTPAASTPGAAGTTGTTVPQPERAPQPEKAPQPETPKQQEQPQKQQQQQN